MTTPEPMDEHAALACALEALAYMLDDFPGDPYLNRHRLAADLFRAWLEDLRGGPCGEWFAGGGRGKAGGRVRSSRR